jgi:hypothetical protein
MDEKGKFFLFKKNIQSWRRKFSLYNQNNVCYIFGFQKVKKKAVLFVA